MFCFVLLLKESQEVGFPEVDLLPQNNHGGPWSQDVAHSTPQKKLSKIVGAILCAPCDTETEPRKVFAFMRLAGA